MRRISLLDVRWKAIASQLDAPAAIKERILETGEIPPLGVQLRKRAEELVEELNLSEEFTNVIEWRVFNPYLRDDLALEEIEKLDISDAAKKRIFEVRKIPPLYDQLVDIVTKSDFPKELKDNILKWNRIPYGSLESPLQEEVLVSVRKKIRNLPISWEVLDQLYMRIDVEALLLNAPPEEVLVQFSFAKNRFLLDHSIPFSVPPYFKKKFVSTVLFNKKVFEVWKPYLQNPNLFSYKHGSALRATFSMIFDGFDIPLEKISEGDEITLRIMREQLKIHLYDERCFLYDKVGLYFPVHQSRMLKDRFA